MKREVLSLAVLFFTANSMAQSSTTLYGVVDDSFSFTNNQAGAHNYQMVNGGRGSSKWGFRTFGELGGGLSAVAVLESGFDINTGKFGNGGRLFGRQSYVALNGPFGSIRLGRQYDLIADSLMPLASSLQFGGVLTSRAADVDNVWGDYSVSNTIKYYASISRLQIRRSIKPWGCGRKLLAGPRRGVESDLHRRSSHGGSGFASTEQPSDLTLLCDDGVPGRGHDIHEPDYEPDLQRLRVGTHPTDCGRWCEHFSW